MFLENDAWELCPVKASFKIVDLSVSKGWHSVWQLSRDISTFEKIYLWKKKCEYFPNVTVLK